MDRSMKSPSKTKPARGPKEAPYNPDSISTERPADRAKFERQRGMPPQGSPAKKMPPMKKR